MICDFCQKDVTQCLLTMPLVAEKHGKRESRMCQECESKKKINSITVVFRFTDDDLKVLNEIVKREKRPSKTCFARWRRTKSIKTAIFQQSGAPFAVAQTTKNLTVIGSLARSPFRGFENG